jgi:hypothetical protein
MYSDFMECNFKHHPRTDEKLPFREAYQQLLRVALLASYRLQKLILILYLGGIDAALIPNCGQKCNLNFDAGEQEAGERKL